jgi:hypothetical protein
VHEIVKVCLKLYKPPFTIENSVAQTDFLITDNSK